MLPTLADTLGMSFEDLIGAPAARRRRQARPRAEYPAAARADRPTPPRQQRMVSQFIDTVLQQHA
jgi:hypothetical protein